MLNLLMLAAAAALQSPVESQPLADFMPDAEIVETLAAAQNGRNRMTVDVFVNDQGPFPFIVDTGATRSVVSSILAARLALPPGPQVRLHDISGAGGVGTARVARMRVGPLETADVMAPSLDPRHIGGQGIIGLDGLADARLVIDFRDDAMTVTKASVRKEPIAPDEIVVTARRKFGQLILADADIDGQKVYVIVDSGAEFSIANSVLRRRLDRSGLMPPPVRIQLTGVSGKPVDADLAYLPKMRIGGFHIGNLPVAFADVHPFRQFGLENKPAMLLGMDLLQAFNRVSLDFGRRTVRFMLPRDKGAVRDADRRFSRLPRVPGAL